MTVIATARTRPPGGVTFVDTPTLLADSDVITVHTPLPRKLTPNSATFTRTGQQHTAPAAFLHQCLVQLKIARDAPRLLGFAI
jgi:phosphoglycerate dehydrogenase-like enzyme